VRFTTGTIRVEADRKHVTLPRLGAIKTHESTRKLARRLQDALVSAQEVLDTERRQLWTENDGDVRAIAPDENQHSHDEQPHRPIEQRAPRSTGLNVRIHRGLSDWMSVLSRRSSRASVRRAADADKRQRQSWNDLCRRAKKVRC
jgi:hypothetical protein